MEINPVNNSAQREIDLQAAREMESYFVHFLLKEMRKTIPKEALLGSASTAQDVYTDMFDQKIAEEIARSGKFGLSDFIMKSVLQREKAISIYQKNKEEVI